MQILLDTPNGDMVELVDTHALEACAFGRLSSSLSIPTKWRHGEMVHAGSLNLLSRKGLMVQIHLTPPTCGW